MLSASGKFLSAIKGVPDKRIVARKDASAHGKRKGAAKTPRVPDASFSTLGRKTPSETGGLWIQPGL